MVTPGEEVFLSDVSIEGEQTLVSVGDRADMYLYGSPLHSLRCFHREKMGNLYMLLRLRKIQQNDHLSPSLNSLSIFYI